MHHEKRGWARVQMGWTNGRGYCSLMSTRGVTGALSDCHGSCWAVRLTPYRAQFLAVAAPPVLLFVASNR